MSTTPVSMTDHIKNSLVGIPGWAKGVILIIIIILISWLVYKFYKDVAPRTDEEKNIDKDKNDFVNQGQKPSFQRSWYDGAVSKLYSMGRGQRIGGTDEQGIYSVFVQLNNDLDLTLLMDAFGFKRKSFSLSEANLQGWIADELSGDGEIAALNNILARRKIKYRF